MSDQRVVEKIDCVGSSGRRYTVVVWQKFRTYTDLSGTVGEAPGTKQLMTSDGQHVNLLDDRRFQIVLTDEILTRV